MEKSGSETISRPGVGSTELKQTWATSALRAEILGRKLFELLQTIVDVPPNLGHLSAKITLLGGK